LGVRRADQCDNGKQGKQTSHAPKIAIMPDGEFGLLAVGCDANDSDDERIQYSYLTALPYFTS
jgi:hypothetical protein